MGEKEKERDTERKKREGGRRERGRRRERGSDSLSHKTEGPHLEHSHDYTDVFMFGTCAATLPASGVIQAGLHHVSPTAVEYGN